MKLAGKNPWKAFPPGQPIIAPSMLACNFACAAPQIDQVIAAGAGVLHIDIMDGHFVPNLSMGPPVAKAFRKYTGHPLDVHLMVTDPAFYLERFAEVGADSITFHTEATNEPEKLCKRIAELGLGVGICVKPGTPASAVAPFVSLVDMVLVMTVEPGFGGQKFMDDMLGKIAAIRGMLQPAQRLQVDGGINHQTAALCAAAGADVFVAGEYVFGNPDAGIPVKRLLEALKKD